MGVILEERRQRKVYIPVACASVLSFFCRQTRIDVAVLDLTSSTWCKSIDRMANNAALAAALNNLANREARFKAPTYRGDTDVELFITQFDAVMAANRWEEPAALLHLRQALEGVAFECGRGATTQEIREALQARFGLTTRQAREKLVNLKRDGRRSLYEHGTLVGKLVSRAYPTLPDADRREMILDHFSRSLDNKELQRHLLAVPPANLTAAIRTTEEFLQIGDSRSVTSRPQMKAMDAAEEPSDMEKMVTLFQRALADQTNAILAAVKPGAAKGEADRSDRRNGRRPISCYHCQGPHVVRECPTAPEWRRTSKSRRPEPYQGNGRGPSN